MDVSVASSYAPALDLGCLCVCFCRHQVDAAGVQTRKRGYATPSGAGSEADEDDEGEEEEEDAPDRRTDDKAEVSASFEIQIFKQHCVSWRQGRVSLHATPEAGVVSVGTCVCDAMVLTILGAGAVGQQDARPGRNQLSNGLGSRKRSRNHIHNLAPNPQPLGKSGLPPPIPLTENATLLHLEMRLWESTVPLRCTVVGSVSLS